VRRELIESGSTWLRLASDVMVDFRLAGGLADPILNEHRPCPDNFAERELLGNDLLSGWYDDWVLVERERFRQLRLHLLESLCDRLIHERRFGRAIEAGLAAVAADPLRESAHRALIRAHLAEGNASEALRQYAAYVALLREELDLEPSADLRALVPVRPQWPHATSR
jgi:DNA-binding SARP family transcriptional activator